MNKKIKLPLALLRAAYIATAVDDFMRPQLESVVIDRGHIVATDGAIMFWAKLEDVDLDLSIIIPRINVECFIKKTENFSDLVCDLVYDPDTRDGYFEIPNCFGCYEAFTMHFMYYPAWQKAIPTHTEDVTGSPQFQTKYHAQLDEISAELGSICVQKIIPNGDHKVAEIEFLFSEFDNVHACLMPVDLTFSKVKYCVEIGGESDDDGPKQLPAASAEIALRATKRLRKHVSHDNGFIGTTNWIRPALWLGTRDQYQEKMFYTEDWFNQPVHQYDNCEKAVNYINAMPDEIVRCFVGNISINARTVEEIEKFFADNAAINTIDQKVDGHA